MQLDDKVNFNNEKKIYRSIERKKAIENTDKHTKSKKGKKKEKTQSKPQTLINEYGQVIMNDERGNIHCITIIGQIEGHMVLPQQNKTTKYEHIIPQLVAIEDNPEIDGLLIILNTVGGDVEAGLAISEMISTMSKPSVSLILGGGHSIGVPLAVSANRSYIASSATMTIHPIRLNGMIIGVPQTYEYFEKVQERIVQFVVKNSKISADTFKGLMFQTGELANDIGTVLFGEEAVKYGIIDEVGGVSVALKYLYKLIAENKKKRGQSI